MGDLMAWTGLDWMGLNSLYGPVAVFVLTVMNVGISAARRKLPETDENCEQVS
jgi:hypothetical protein